MQECVKEVGTHIRNEESERGKARENVKGNHKKKHHTRSKVSER